jgi:hypothetical protein
MMDVFWYYLSTLVFINVFGALLCVYRYYLGNRLTQQASKLKSQMANINRYYPEFEEKKSSIVASAIGDLGIDGIMKELGIDPKLLNNPLVKGLIEKYAPRLIEQLGKGKNASNAEETGLL